MKVEVTELNTFLQEMIDAFAVAKNDPAREDKAIELEARLMAAHDGLLADCTGSQEARVIDTPAAEQFTIAFREAMEFLKGR